MHSIGKLAIATAVIMGVSTAAWAQGGSPSYGAVTSVTAQDPPGPMPDASHVPVILPKDIKWTGKEGENQQAVVFGDPNKPGPYGVIYRWYPGHFSQPHMHSMTRWAYVVSGTWWVSTSNTFDVKTTYPIHAGTVATDVANTVHWDGCRAGEKEPAILFLVGEGPMATTQVGPDGKPLPPRAPAK
jgi:hypothetical protein